MKESGMVDALPLTPHGQLDKRALPAPEYQDVDRYRAPANAVEEILASIFARCLVSSGSGSTSRFSPFNNYLDCPIIGIQRILHGEA